MFEVVGYHPDEVPPTADWWDEQIHPDDLPRVNGEHQLAVATGADRFVTTYRVRHKDGRWLHVMDRALFERNAADKVVRILGCAVDISEQKQAEETLREDDRRKDEFLATLAHELRNPLAPLRNALEVMRLDPDNSEMFAHLNEIMERQLGHMVRLVDDLLDVSRITRGKIELRKERIDVAKVVESALETSRPLIEAGKPSTLRPVAAAAGVRHGRSDSAGAGRFESAEQRRQIHAPDGQISLTVEAHGGEVVDPRARQWHRHSRRRCCRACSTCSRRSSHSRVTPRAASASA